MTDRLYGLPIYVSKDLDAVYAVSWPTPRPGDLYPLMPTLERLPISASALRNLSSAADDEKPYATSGDGL